MLRFQPTVWDTVAKWCFYIHLTVSALLATVIIILHPIIRRPSIAFATLIIYGYLIVLLALIHMTMMVTVLHNQVSEQDSLFDMVQQGRHQNTHHDLSAAGHPDLQV